MNMAVRLARVLVLPCALLAGTLTAAVAAEVKVLASNAMTTVMDELVPAFERTSGHKLSVVYAPTADIMTRIKGGETADAIILIRQSIDALKKDGKVVADTDTEIARTGIGLAVKSGAPKPDISTPDAFKATMLRAKSVSASETGASGTQFRRVLDRLGITEEMKPKLRLVQGATPTATLVAKDEAEMAVNMMSELTGVAGTEIVGPFPGDLAFDILLVGAVDASAKEAGAGRELLRFLASRDAAPVLTRKGMQGPQS